MPVADSAASIAARLRASGSVYAEAEAALLIDAAPGADDLALMVAARVEGRPIEHIVGWAEFCGVRVAVDAGVFVPRQRSELLADLAIAATVDGDVVVDLCCGAGGLGLVVAAARQRIELHAADIDPVAVECARRNIAVVGGRAHAGDLFDALPPALSGRVDVIVANAPYVPTSALDLMPREARLHEPVHTLDGGSDGLDIQRRIVARAAAWLAPDGELLLETSEDQAATSAAITAAAGLLVRVERSDDLDATVVVGTLARQP